MVARGVTVAREAGITDVEEDVEKSTLLSGWNFSLFSCLGESNEKPAADSLHRLHDPSSREHIDPSMWGVSREDIAYFEGQVRGLWERGDIPEPEDPKLRDSRHNDPKIGPNIYQVVEHYVKPATQDAGGMSWALMRNPKGLQCDLFATHAWSEGVFEFTRKLLSSWPQDAKGAYVCFLANPQTSGVSRLLAADLADSPFARALSAARYYVIIPNRFSSVYNRLWCVFETHLAFEKAEKDPDFQIFMAQPLSYFRVAMYCIPAYALPIAGACLLDATSWAHDISCLFGPLMWVVVIVILCELLHQIAERTATCLSHVPMVPMYFSVACCYMELFLTGVGAGMAWIGHFSGLIDHTGHHHMQVQFMMFKVKDDQRYEKGERWAVFAVFVAVVLTAVHKVFMSLVRQVLETEGMQMGIESVFHADCFSSKDKLRIQREIDGEEARIELQLIQLREVGRYNMAIKREHDLGINASHLRNSTLLRIVLKACASSAAWSTWWVTDMAGRGHTELALCILGVLVVIMIVVVRRWEIRLVYAVHWFYNWGIFFAFCSNNHHFFTRNAVLTFTMTEHTLALELAIFGAYLFQCWHYYTFGRSCRKGKLCFGMTCPGYEQIVKNADEAENMYI